MTAERRQLLRLADEWKARAYTQIGGRYGKLPRDKRDPVAVKTAKRAIAKHKKIVDKHERMCRRRHERAVNTIHEIYNGLRTAAYFEKPEIVLRRIANIPNQSK